MGYGIDRVVHECQGDSEQIIGVVSGDGKDIRWFLEKPWEGSWLRRCPHCDDIQPLPTSLEMLLAIIADEKGAG